MDGGGPQLLSLELLEKRLVAERVVALRLAAADGGPLPAWEPGAHVELSLPGGLVRHYSLCGDPADRAAWRLGVLREEAGRGGSAFVHDRLQPGDRLSASPPRNHFALLPGARRTLLVAGGIGITPLLPMIARLAAEKREWRLVYGGRRRAAMAFLDELAPHGERVTCVPQDKYGPIDLDAVLAGLAPSDAVYCCGPEGLIAAVEERFRSGLPGRLHVERFRADGAAVDHGEAFNAVLRRSGRSLHVPAGMSLLDALQGAGIDVPSSCREGVCGTCEVAVVGGRPDHRDHVLSAGERASNRMMMACVSRACDGRIELDL
jgi:ferredoxin-NADP reductase